MVRFLLAAESAWAADGGFLSRLLNGWALDSQKFVRDRLPHLLVIAIVAFALSRMLRSITFHMIRVAEQHASGPTRIAQVKTLAGIIRTTGLAVIGIIAGLQILDNMGVNLGPLLESAGIAGIAIGLAAQNIVKDMFNGILILLEDQFNVGDTVRVAGVTGAVEAMTLRRTTVRDTDGTLYVVPNSQITTVANLSAGFTAATVNISVDFSADPDQVIALLNKIAMDIRLSDDFRQLFVADPQVLGVDSVKGSEMVFPVVFKTLATKQYGPVREFRRRVRLALEENHLLPGDPYRVFRSFENDAEIVPHRSGSAPAAHDPTANSAHDSNPFSSQ